MGARLVVTGTVLVALAGLGSLSACTGSDDDAPKATAVDDTGKGVPKGDEATYLKALRAIDPALVADEKTAIDNGYNLCLDARNGMTTGEQVNDAISLFETDVKKAQRVLSIATANLCETPPSAGS
ncbi:hypothetical protein C8E87_6601 [Paractinoplanes brasiliensis]|uniref:Uncharacterized protein n=1 Tax=Paractinoplanes brasiliensis TaxID=52695 RepID=A0A4R6J6S9_9ACTN|nr:hypothetical protein C8E87_6601 [Actinoplanes brasiliensis]GID28495.1 hypothetical protein Abr02nite_34780 [Actinoplanes brasiliensis]